MNVVRRVGCGLLCAYSISNSNQSVILGYSDGALAEVESILRLPSRHSTQDTELPSLGPDCVKTQNQRKTGGVKTTPNIPIVVLRVSGGVGFLRGVLQSRVFTQSGPSPVI